MKHIIVNNYGMFLGLKSQRLTIKQDGNIKNEIALNRVKSIQILSKGISLSSDLVNSCSQRGIKIFFNTFKKGLELVRQLIIVQMKLMYPM